MSKKMTVISVQDIPISVAYFQENDYICITDMAKAKTGESRAADVIKNWIRNRSTLEFLGTWESLYNPDFKVVEFDHFKMQAGLPTFTLSAKQWIESTNAIGIYVQAGRYGGTHTSLQDAITKSKKTSPALQIYSATAIFPPLAFTRWKAEWST